MGVVVNRKNLECEKALGLSFENVYYLMVGW